MFGDSPHSPDFPNCGEQFAAKCDFCFLEKHLINDRIHDESSLIFDTPKKWHPQ